jgi:hypothetical protein
MSKYNLVYPTVKDTLDCVHYSSDLYWRDERAFSKIEEFVNTLTDIERASVVYVGDFYQIRNHNPGFVKSFLEKMITPTYDLTSTKTLEECIQILKDSDDQVISFVHYVHSDIVKGLGKDYTKLTEREVKILTNTLTNVNNFFNEHKDLVSELLLSSTMPVSVAYINDQVRRTTLVLDTDSNIFSVDEWVDWYKGDCSELSVAAAVQFIVTKSVAHLLVMLSSNIGVEKAKLYNIAMKPEFFFPVFVLAPVAKHYYASIGAREGNIYTDTDYELKGVNLKSSSLPQDIVEDAHKHIRYILDEVRQGHKLSIINEIARVIEKEEHIKDKVLAGDPAYFKKLVIKSPDSYKLPPEQSNYFHLLFWMDNFSRIYKYTPVVPYEAIRVSLTLANPTAIKEYLNSLEDRILASSLENWFKKYNKTHFESLLLPSDFCKSYAIPKELVPIINIKKLQIDLLIIDRIILATLGMYIKNDLRVSDQYGYLLGE